MSYHISLSLSIMTVFKGRKRRGKNLSEPPTLSSNVVLPERSACRLLGKGQRRVGLGDRELIIFLTAYFFILLSIYLGKEQVVQDSISQESG